MENIDRILQDIKGLPFPEKMKLTIKIWVSYLKESLQKVSTNKPYYTSKSMNLPLNRAFDNIIKHNNEGFLQDEEICTGFSNLDKHIHGFKKGSLTIIGGRPSMGKSIFLLNIVKNMLTAGQRVGFVPMEMNSVRLTKQLLYLYAEVSPFNRMEKKEIEKIKLAKSVLEDKPIFQFSYKKILPGVDEFINACQNMVKKNQVEIMFIDYLQLIDSGLVEVSEYENLAYEHVVIELKKFARKYNIPLVIASSLTKDVALRSGDKRPIITDIPGSGIIEELADNILLLHRPYYYGIIEDEEGNKLTGLMEVIIAKSKTGEIGEMYLRKNPGKMRLDEA